MYDDVYDLEFVSTVLGEGAEHILYLCSVMGICLVQRNGERLLRRSAVKRLYEVYNAPYVPPEVA